MFTIGNEYPRNELLNFVGSKQGQSGVIWGPRETGCVIVTSGGRHSKRAGYHDERLPDGSWDYFGQGEKGDQDPDRYANSLLSEQDRTVLLFTTKEPTSEQVKLSRNYSKKYRFEGLFNVLSWTWHIPKAGSRKGNSLIKFHFVPVNEGSKGEEVSAENYRNRPIDYLLLRKELSGNYRTENAHQTVIGYYLRCGMVREYTRWRAAGTCEACGSRAPFVKSDGNPFLEVHHLNRLADDGPDIPVNVAGLCPNCHREAHYGRDCNNLKNRLKQIIIEKEQNIEKGKTIIGK